MLKSSRPARRAFAFLMLLFAVPVFSAGAAAQPPQPTPTPLPSPYTEAEMPPGEGGTLYPYPIIPSRPGLGDGTSTPAELTVNVWYGDTQVFEIGTPQQWVNILGDVSGPNPVTSLTYRLNGKAARTLNMGADRLRLWSPGDFNIELYRADLEPAPATNTVAITAQDGTTTVTKTVSVIYKPSAVWPLPYTADWDTLDAVTDGAQVVDGRWRLAGGKLETVVPGFDRLVAVGDLSWTDYEATVPLRVHSINTAGWVGPSNGAGIGLISRWEGHYLLADEQPRLGWRNLGALAWHHWYVDGTTQWEMRGDTGKLIDTDGRNPVQLGVDYFFKLRVESSETPGQPATYRLKHWRASEPEPNAWTLEAAGVNGEPLSGSLVLVAHQVMASFGDVVVTPLNVPPPPPTYLPVIVSPKADTTVAGVAYTRNDLLSKPAAGTPWAEVFDGPAAGVTANVVAFASDGGRWLMTFGSNQALNVSGARATFTPWDVAGYDPAAAGWTWELDGSDVGLTTKAEKIDALAIDPADGALLISTAGTAAVKDAAGLTLKAADEDLIAFHGTGGAASSGSWSRRFDGSTVRGLAVEDVVGASAAGGDLYLSIAGAFAVDGVRGGSNHILRLRPRAGGYDVAMAWSGPDNGFAGTFDAFEVGP